MRYIKKFENFTPIKINNAKSFKVKKNLTKNIQVLQKSIQSLRRRLQDEDSIKRRAEMNRDINTKIKKLSDLTFYQLKQAEYFKNNPIIESVENEDNRKTLIEILESKDFKPEDILKYIGLDEKEYEIPKEWDYHENEYLYKYGFNGFTLLMKEERLCELMDVENDIFSWFLQFTGYNNYENYVDYQEMDYLHYYLTEENLNKIKKLADIFNYKIDVEKEGEIIEFFQYLGLKDELEYFKDEISAENEEAVSKAAKDTLNTLPFDIDNYSGDNNFNIELYFDYNTIIEYMKKDNMSVYTIEEFLENINESSNFSYEIEYTCLSSYTDGYKDLKKSVDNKVEKYIDSPDDIFPKIIAVDNLEAIKNNFDLCYFDYVYDYSFKYDKKRGDLFDIAKTYDGKILEWFTTDEFKNKVKNSVTKEYYNELVKKIDDYKTLTMSQKYNL
jgi:hypothetical protein